MICCAFYALRVCEERTKDGKRSCQSAKEHTRETGQFSIKAHLLTKTHVEIMLDTVAASRDLVPDTFGMALVKRLDEVCTICTSLKTSSQEVSLRWNRGTDVIWRYRDTYAAACSHLPDAVVVMRRSTKAITSRSATVSKAFYIAWSILCAWSLEIENGLHIPDA